MTNRDIADRIIRRIKRINKIFDGNNPDALKLERLEQNIDKLMDLAFDLKNDGAPDKVVDGKELFFSKSTNIYIPEADGTGGVVPPNRPVILTQAGIPKGKFTLMSGDQKEVGIYAGNHNDNREHYRFNSSAEDLVRRFKTKSAIGILETSEGSYFLSIDNLLERQG